MDPTRKLPQQQQKVSYQRWKKERREEDKKDFENTERQPNIIWSTLL